jgi:hypothetical protein
LILAAILIGLAIVPTLFLIAIPVRDPLIIGGNFVLTSFAWALVNVQACRSGATDEFLLTAVVPVPDLKAVSLQVCCEQSFVTLVPPAELK